ncbi:hypothetical protein BC832DRAFT_141721 [Gaertneriomyces semiglobifer]|nr:hypothetical protein BC832DRAFT_141721 [Gaertneriomyces semiglobifer]
MRCCWGMGILSIVARSFPFFIGGIDANESPRSHLVFHVSLKKTNRRTAAIPNLSDFSEHPRIGGANPCDVGRSIVSAPVRSSRTHPIPTAQQPFFAVPKQQNSTSCGLSHQSGERTYFYASGRAHLLWMLGTIRGMAGFTTPLSDHTVLTQ